MIDENGVFTEEFTQKLPDMLGDDYYNDPETKQQPTKAFQNIKDLAGLAKTHVNAQRTISKGDAAFAERIKGMVKVPNEKSTPEEIAAYRKAVNVPDSADGYELKIPEGDNKAGYSAVAEVVSKALLDGNIPKTAAQAIWEGVLTTLNKQSEDIEAKGLALIEADIEAQKAIHKEKYPAFVKAGDDTLAKLTSGPEAVKILEAYGIKNHPAIRAMLHEISPLILEGKTFAGDGFKGTKPAEDGVGLDYSEDVKHHNQGN